LFTMQADGSDAKYIQRWLPIAYSFHPSFPPSPLSYIHNHPYITLPSLYYRSWSSDKYVPIMCDGKNSTMNPDNQRDGNHPNWVPGTHKISMNIGESPPSPPPSFL